MVFNSKRFFKLHSDKLIIAIIAQLSDCWDHSSTMNWLSLMISIYTARNDVKVTIFDSLLIL